MTICSSHLSTHAQTEQAVDEACEVVRDGLGGQQPDLALVFASTHHHARLDNLPAELRRRLGARHLIGCTGEAIVGQRREIEEEPALSLWAAALPEMQARPFHVHFSQADDEIAVHGWPAPAEPLDPPPLVLLFPEPFSSVPQLLLDRFEQDYPGAAVIGGVASGAMRPGKNRLFLDDAGHEHGAVGLVLWGGAPIRTVVSQGCRPIGRHLVITRASHNVIHQLSGKPAFEQFQEIYHELTEPEQQLARRALHIGCVINEYQTEFRRGDFLVRNIMGIDQQAGAIAITDHVRVGQTVQFHVRDAETASEDLRLMLGQAGEPPVAGALLFTCNGRGTRLFDGPNHDARQVHDSLGDVPLAGFFAQGEIGPVGEKNFLHGYTASLALFA